MMKHLCIVCEGYSEEDFVRITLAPYLRNENLIVYPAVVPTSPGHYGGGLSYPRLQRFISHTLKEKTKPFVTTLIDLHKLHSGFPCFEAAVALPDLTQKLDLLQQEWRKDIVSEVQCRPERFIPYIQPYEFEALLFSDISSISAHMSQWSTSSAQLEKARAAVSSPEHMNTKKEKTPSYILEQSLTSPPYDKRLHGNEVLAQIGLNKIQQECLHFARWLDSLRALR